MNIFRFAKWWWEHRGPDEKAVVCLFSWMIISFVNAFIVGVVSAFGIFVSGFLLVLFSIAIRALYSGTRNQYAEFRLEKEKEAQNIVNKLKGIS